MRLKVYAKTNLTLDIVGRRADGYHLLDSVMQSVSLFDRITLTPASAITVNCSVPALSGEENIAFSAAKRFFETTGLSGGVTVEIEKHIPQAAGLGGGSADAAGVLTGLNAMFDHPLSDEALSRLALTLGADVPFCLTGGTRRAQGVGETLTPLCPLPASYFVFVKAGQKASTGAMYGKLDAADPAPAKTEAMVKALEMGKLSAVAGVLGNAFLSVCETDALKKAFDGTAPLGFSLSGSGPTVFGLYEIKDAALSAVASLRGAGYEPLLATGTEFGVETE